VADVHAHTQCSNDWFTDNVSQYEFNGEYGKKFHVSELFPFCGN